MKGGQRNRSGTTSQGIARRRQANTTAAALTTSQAMATIVTGNAVSGATKGRTNGG